MTCTRQSRWTERRQYRVGGWSLAAGALAVGLAGAGWVSTSAAAGTLPASLQQFAHCPVNDPSVSLCLAAADTGSFSINSTTLTETSPITVSLGLVLNPDGSYTAVVPDDGTSALVAPPITVPGGLLGIPGSGGPLAVTATPQLVGSPTFSLFNLEARKGAAITLPTDVQLNNFLLGGSCTVGSASSPVTLNLTDGKTSPPPPNTPLTGALGKLKVSKSGVLTTKGTRLVDNSYAVPGANGCGLLGLFDPIVNLQKHLPSAAGTNSVSLTGASGLAPASLIRKYLG